MIATLRAEWAKTLRRPRTYVALGLVVLVPAIVTLALRLNTPGLNDTDRFFFVATRTGLLMPAAELRLMSPLLLLVVVAFFAGEAIAGEAGSGNLRYVLLRPVPRGRLLSTKLVIAASLSLAAAVLLMLTATVLGGLAFGFKSIQAQEHFVDQSVGNLFVHIGMATGYVSWALSSVIAFGFMISTMTTSSAAAAGSAVGFGVTSQILNEIHSLGAVRDVLPLRYFDAWTGLFWSNRVPHDVYSGLILPIPYVVAFCAVAWWWFRRKDVLA